MNRPIGGLRRSAFCASHRFNRADATAATTTPAAIGKAFCAMGEGVRARYFVSIKCTVGRLGRCTTARASEDVALRDNGGINRSFPRRRRQEQLQNERRFRLGGSWETQK